MKDQCHILMILWLISNIIKIKNILISLYLAITFPKECNLTSFAIPSCLESMRMLRQFHSCHGNNLQGNGHSSPQQGDQTDEVILRVTLTLRADMEQNTQMKHQTFRTEETLCHPDRQTTCQKFKSFSEITLFITIKR